MLNVAMNDDNGVLKVKLEGKLDATSASDFGKQLEEAVEGKTGVIYDCERLDYISSAGLRVILWSQQYLESNGHNNIELKHVNEIVKEILEDTGFIDIIKVD